MLKVLLLAAVAPGMAFLPACSTHLAAAAAPSSRTSSAVRASAASSDSTAPVSQSPPKALLVAGAGVLGRRVAAQYHARGLGQVTAETRSEANHDAILVELPFLGRWDAKAYPHTPTHQHRTATTNPLTVPIRSEMFESSTDILVDWSPNSIPYSASSA